METGKIEYAPDYKSSSAVSKEERLRRMARDSSANTMEFDAAGAHRYHTEHQRLKDEVVEAAKADRVAESAGNGGNSDIDALIAS